jgi:hypothetical protein
MYGSGVMKDIEPRYLLFNEDFLRLIYAIEIGKHCLNNGSLKAWKHNLEHHNKSVTSKQENDCRKNNTNNEQA